MLTKIINQLPEQSLHSETVKRQNPLFPDLEAAAISRAGLLFPTAFSPLSLRDGDCRAEPGSGGRCRRAGDPARGQLWRAVRPALSRHRRANVGFSFFPGDFLFLPAYKIPPAQLETEIKRRSGASLGRSFLLRFPVLRVLRKRS